MKTSRLLRKVARRAAESDYYTCLRLRDAENDNVDTVSVPYYTSPAVKEYIEVYTSVAGQAGADAFSEQVAKVPTEERKNLRVLLTLFAAEVLESEGK